MLIRSKKTLSYKKEKPEEKKKHDYQIYNYILHDCIGRNDTPDGIIQTQYKNALIKFIEERKIPQPLKYLLHIQVNIKEEL